MEGPISSLVTDAERIKSEIEAKIAILQEERDLKNQMIEESLQRLREHQQVLKRDSLEFDACYNAFKAGFEPIQKKTQEELDRSTAEIVRADDEIDAFIGKITKDCENLVKTLKGNEV